MGFAEFRPLRAAPVAGVCFKLTLVVFYVALVAAGGFAAFYLQQALEEVHQIGAKNEETARVHAGLHGQMESVLQQVGDPELVLLNTFYPSVRH